MLVVVLMVPADHVLGVRSKHWHRSCEMLDRELNDSMILEQADIRDAPDKQPVVLVKLDSLMCRLPFLLAITFSLAFFLILQLR